MENVACPVCGEEKAGYLWTKEGSRYVRCVECSLVYENPRLTEQELIEFYSQKSYFVQEGASVSTSGYRDYYAQCTEGLREDYFGLVERHARTNPGAYCDVGCGPGGLLKIAQTRGWNAVGVEISSWAVREGRNNGLTIIEGSLLNANLPSDHFDAVTMFDVLEHLTHPREYLNEIHRVLKPGGILIVETPNVDGFFTKRVYRENADLVKPRSHICLYSRKSAARLVSRVRFRSVKVATFPYCRKITLGYLKNVVTSRLLKGRNSVQMTFNDSLRILCWK